MPPKAGGGCRCPQHTDSGHPGSAGPQRPPGRGPAACLAATEVESNVGTVGERPASLSARG